MIRRPLQVVAVVGLLASALLTFGWESPARGSLPPVRKLVAITVQPSTTTLIPGGTQQYTATGQFSDGTSEDLTGQVVFRSREPKVAVVDPATGLATAVDSGRSEISATDPTSKITSKTTGKLSVAELEAISVSPAKAGIRVGGSLVVRALATYSNGAKDIDITDHCDWVSGKPSVARIEKAPDGTVSVTGIIPGSAILVAKERESGFKSSNKTGLLTVVDKLASVAVSPAKKVVRIGDRSKLKAIGTFAKGATADITADVNWAIEDPAIATIDEQGRVEGVSVGSTVASATDKLTGITSTASAGDSAVQVVGDLSALKITPTNVVVQLGESIQLKAAALFAGETSTINLTSKVTWSVSDPALVSVTNAGLATCLGKGTAVISARDPVSGITSTAGGGDANLLCGLRLDRIKIVPDVLTLGLAKTKKLKAFFVYENGFEVDSTKKVTWSSSASKVASVDNTDPNIGRVSALTGGTATISATDPVSGLKSTDSGGVSCTVTVPGNPIGIQIQPRPPTVGYITGKLGQTLQLKVLARFFGGTTQGLNAEVTWTSSNPAVAKVSNGAPDPNPAGFTQFLRTGDVKVTITWPKTGVPLPPGATPLTDVVSIKVVP